jgi:hypothetical protein
VTNSQTPIFETSPNPQFIIANQFNLTMSLTASITQDQGDHLLPLVRYLNVQRNAPPKARQTSFISTPPALAIEEPTPTLQGN